MDLKSKILANRENGAQGKFTVMGRYLSTPYVQEQQTTSTSMKFDSRTIRALGFKNWAKDAKPEEVADALEVIQREASDAVEEHVKGCRCDDCMGTEDEEKVELIPEEDLNKSEFGVGDQATETFTDAEVRKIMDEVIPVGSGTGDTLGDPGDPLSFFNGRTYEDGLKAYIEQHRERKD